MTTELPSPEPDAWHVLVCGLSTAESSFDLGEGLELRRLHQPLTIFDLAAAGAVGFREWATIDPLAASATTEIVSPTALARTPGYDALNKCWLASTLLVLRGFVSHLCPAFSAYSWSMVAGHQKLTSGSFREQLAEEGSQAVFKTPLSLPPFQGGLLDYHLRLWVPQGLQPRTFDSAEAAWFRAHFHEFNDLAANSEKFRFALEAIIDWRFAKERRSALARLWTGIESLFDLHSELVYRISLLSATVMAPRGPERVAAYRAVKKLYEARSKAVHGAPLPPAMLAESITGSFHLLSQLLLDAVTHGRVRSDEDHLLELLG